MTRLIRRENRVERGVRECANAATVQRAILDKEVVIEPGATVGVDRDLDLSRGFTVSESGVTVVAKGLVVSA